MFCFICSIEMIVHTHILNALRKQYLETRLQNLMKNDSNILAYIVV